MYYIHGKALYKNGHLNQHYYNFVKFKDKYVSTNAHIEVYNGTVSISLQIMALTYRYIVFVKHIVTQNSTYLYTYSCVICNI